MLLLQKKVADSNKPLKIKYDAEEKILINQIKELNSLRTERVELLNKWIWQLESLWQFICNQLKIRRSELSGLHYQEIIESLSKNKPLPVSHKELRLRNIAYNFIRTKDGLIYSSATLQKNKSIKFVKEAAGMTGNPGKAVGMVRVIGGADDFKKFKKGEILIAPQTTPNFVAIMIKSKAIVTDMGGITCHAAIVSRELKKPCVIGTKIATKIFKDGDLVEVDADKGIVKKLN
jgi:phosphohistidine swiveling domain-containing protein